jgi:hypothetical protein
MPVVRLIHFLLSFRNLSLNKSAAAGLMPKERSNVCGLKTAVTLWCVGVVGPLADSGLLSAGDEKHLCRL